jgi:hypothetical protein
MKKLMLIAGLIACSALQTFAQGQFSCKNTADAAVYIGYVGSSQLVGTDYTYDFVYAKASGVTSSDGLTVASSTKAGKANGLFSFGTITVDNYKGTISFQVRCWETSLGSTYSAAYSADGGNYTGKSDIIEISLSVAPAPVTLLSDAGFKSFYVTVPEPTTIAHCAMGL